MTVSPPSTETVVEAHASEPRDDYDSDSWQEDLLLAAAYEHMDWPARLFGADDDPAAKARREEHRRAVFAEWDRESEARAREFRERQAAERQRKPRKPRKPTPEYLATLANKPGVARVEMKPDGTVLITTGNLSVVDNNPWDVAAAALRQKKELQ